MGEDGIEEVEYGTIEEEREREDGRMEMKDSDFGRGGEGWTETG
jgi:hypothetical protein